MEDNFYRDDFEQFLQKQANNYRMYPSDGLWPAIQKKLHGPKNWPALTFTAFAILLASIAVSLYFAPKPDIFKIADVSSTASVNAPAATNPHANSALISQAAKNFIASNHRHFSSNNNTNSNTATNTQNDGSGNIAAARPVASNAVATTATNALFKNDLAFKTAANNRAMALLPAKIKPAAELIEQLETIDGLVLQEDDVTENTVAEVASASQFNQLVHATPAATAAKQKNANAVDTYLGQHPDDIPHLASKSVQSRKRRFSYTVYLTPSMSFRKLREDNILNKGSIPGPVAPGLINDVNKLVRHRPGTGIETGIGFTYHLSNTIGITTGLQFNMRKYFIEAYKTPHELAPIALLGTRGIDTINAIAIYRSTNGYSSAELQNRYFQLSVPVGITWQVMGNQKVNFNLAATVQPTYNLNRKSYLLSANFKNYAATQDMLRTWNVNSSVEAFINVKVGRYNWQVGPQFRYQQLPTLTTRYPIREHLMDYGVKVGVSKVLN